MYNKWRKYLSIVALPILIGMMINTSWKSGEDKAPAIKPAPNASSVDSSSVNSSSVAKHGLSIKERMLDVQARMLVGGLVFIKKNEHSNIEQDKLLVAKVREILSGAAPVFLQANFLTLTVDANTMLPPEDQLEIEKRLILAKTMGYTEIQAQLEGSLPALDKLPEDVVERRAVLSDFLAGSIDPIKLTEKYQYIGELSASFLTLEDAPVLDEASKALAKMVVGMGLFGTLVIVSFLSFLVYLVLILRGKLQYHFTPTSIQREYVLEVFVLYLAGMLALPLLFQQFDILKESKLLFNVIAIPALATILIWPKFFGASFSSIFSSFGFKLGGVKKILTDLIVAPTVYLGFWVPLIAVLFIYTLVLQILGVSIEEGAHPIVPILLDSKNSTVFLTIMILAVVVAPVIEEIMFRGVFYSWLRSFLSPIFAIPISAFIFAIIHPQGAIGIVPLTLIGMMLAFLREWRGSLVAPMLAHACVNGGTMLMLYLFLL
jgi:membrane protease YdiL (CAAX protease family)